MWAIISKTNDLSLYPEVSQQPLFEHALGQIVRLVAGKPAQPQNKN
jgi:hypothetical protein